MAPPGVAIEIHGMGETSSRMSLKKLMEQFGDVIGCHIGQRGVDKPVVRYPTPESAEAALNALRNRQVWLDGVVLGGDWQKAAPPPEPEPAMVTSRDLFAVPRRGGRSRSRSRGGRGRRDWHREDRDRRPRSRSRRRSDRDRDRDRER
mmetsp:Transcript_125396/g.250282  ORF Transcript_125396/g.250282 Transcript_125396/m.250282 type:complete len:148 (-) Transcript_125396:105-548(-)